MTPEDSFSRQETRTDRSESFDARPHNRIGAENLHDDSVVSGADLREEVRGSPCRPFNGDGGVETGGGPIRRPDVGVDRGPRDPLAVTAALPKLIVGALSPTSRDFDAFNKLNEYKGMAGVDCVILVEPNEPLASVWSRDEKDQWAEKRVRGLDAAIELPELNLSLRMDAVSEGVDVPAPGRRPATSAREMWIDDVKDSPLVREIIEIAARQRLEEARRNGIALGLARRLVLHAIEHKFDLPCTTEETEAVLAAHANEAVLTDMVSKIDAMTDFAAFIENYGVTIPCSRG